MWFEINFGLKINSEKSELFLVRRVANVEELVSVLECGEGRAPHHLLGPLPKCSS